MSEGRRLVAPLGRSRDYQVAAYCLTISLASSQKAWLP